MRAIGPLLAATIGLAALVAPVASVAQTDAASALAAPPQNIRLGGVAVHLRAGTAQVVTVKHTHGTYARVSLWALKHGEWRRQLTTTDGRTGYGGLVAGAERHQGTGTTPLGSYGLISSFGTQRAKASWDLPYRKIKKGDYWVEDNRSAYYNRYRNKAQGGFRWWLPLSNVNGSERLSDYPQQYADSIVLDYNRQQVRHRGAGIFLHVNGSGPTAGCVSAPRWMLQSLLHRLTPKRVPVIAIGR